MPLACLILTGALLAFFSQASAVAGSAAYSTSTSDPLLLCGNNCFALELAQSTCPQADASCLCVDEPLVATTRSCAVVNCTLDEVITWEKFRATTCDVPVRNKSREILAIEWTLFSIAILAVSMRLMARATTVGGHGLDDALLVVSTLLLVFMVVMQTLMVSAGFGKDIWGVPLDKVQKFELYQWICVLIYIPQVTTMKMSIIFLYLRLFPATVSRLFRMFCWFMIASGFVFIFLAIIIFTFACKPVSLSWHGLYRHHQDKCINLPGVLYLALGLNLGADLVVFTMPIPKILKMEAISTRNKCVTSFMFLLGLVVTVASTVRMAWLTSFLYSTNFTYDHANFDILSFVEDSLGIVCACVPPSLGLFRYMSRRYKGQLSSKRSTPSLPRFAVQAKDSDDGRENGGITVWQSFSNKHSRRSQVGSRRDDDDDDFELMTDEIPSLRPDGKGLRYEVKAEMGVPSLRSVPSEAVLDRAESRMTTDRVSREITTTPRATFLEDG